MCFVGSTGGGFYTFLYYLMAAGIRYTVAFRNNFSVIIRNDWLYYYKELFRLFLFNLRYGILLLIAVNQTYLKLHRN